MGARTFYVYILASKIGGTLYIGVTNDLIRRVAQHKAKPAEGFTKKYDVDRLVYFECFEDVEQAIHREKRLKKWPRAWKIKLIEDDNPNWSDLYPGLAGAGSKRWCLTAGASGILGRPVTPGDDKLSYLLIVLPHFRIPAQHRVHRLEHVAHALLRDGAFHHYHQLGLVR